MQPQIMRFLYFSFFVFFSTIVVEIFLSKRHGKNNYAWQESLSSLAIAIGHHFSLALSFSISTSLLFLAWEHRLTTISMEQWWSIPLLFLGIEFCYYWYHRSAHKVRWLWATHAVHHTSKHYNLSAAYRLGWTNWLSGNVLFFVPLCWLGFPPIAIVTGLMLNLTYQFWLHTELIPKLGIFESIFNTPSHHRVHHASNPEYLDRNFGGVLIVFDRLFGTLAVEKSNHSIAYGLTHPINSFNPFSIAFFEWKRLGRDLLKAKTWREFYQIILGTPN
jgi:sterol desaturase/sphingolipid hydroxylase (fatty acid hydroxylase superfamily)